MDFCFRSPSPEHTAEAGLRLAQALGDVPWVLALQGELGAGKTAFVRGVAAGLGVDSAAVASPTFVLAHEYRGTEKALVHLDAYRIEDSSELELAGFDDYLDGRWIVAVEWSEKVADLLPDDHLSLAFSRAPGHPQTRTIVARARSNAGAATLRAWREALKTSGVAIQGESSLAG